MLGWQGIVFEDNIFFFFFVIIITISAHIVVEYMRENILLVFIISMRLIRAEESRQ